MLKTEVYREFVDSEINKMASVIEEDEKYLQYKKNSFMKGAGVGPSARCQCSFERKYSWERFNNYHCDVRYVCSPSEVKKFGKQKILEADIKTKRTVVDKDPVEHDYDASIVGYLLKSYFRNNKKPHLYLLYRYDEKTKLIIFCGYITPAEYFANSEFMIKFEHDPSNDFFINQDCYNVKYPLAHSTVEEAVYWWEEQKIFRSDLHDLLIDTGQRMRQKIISFDFQGAYDKVKRERPFLIDEKEDSVSKRHKTCVGRYKEYQRFIKHFYLEKKR